MTRNLSIVTRPVFILLLLPVPLRAQTVTGTVASAGNPIVGTTVRLLKLDRIEHTGAQGQFTFSNVPKGVYRVFTGVTGYASAKQTRLGEGDTPTAGYAVVNLGVGMRFARQRVVNNISLHCDNVFNTVYRDNLSVIKDFIPQPARGFRLNYQAVY
jgi:hypothetical protein